MRERERERQTDRERELTRLTRGDDRLGASL